MALLTYQYRLYPRRAEAKRLDTLLYQGKLVYNFALEVCKNTYEATGESVKALSLWRYFRDWRNSQPEAERVLNASSVQHLLRRLDKAYAAFFRRIKAGEKAGHPRFKSHDRFNSVEYTYGDGVKLVQDDRRVLLYVHRIGSLKVKVHRRLPTGAVIKHVVIKRKAGGWYVNLQLEVPTPEFVPNGQPLVAGDVGMLRLLTLSDGTGIDNPRWLRGTLKKLRRAQRRLSRRQKGSNRRRKARRQVALLHEQVANTRRDFWHKVTTALVNTYGAIALEALNLNFMLRNGRLSLSAHDADLGIFYALLDSKAANAGCTVVCVDPAYTSQICSGCGCLVEKDLRVRDHDCPHCGLTIDRDLNAARNIFKSAFEYARIGRSGINAAPLPPPSGDGKRTRSLRSSPL
ncbi:MAG: transposase [Anaerolineae bacterium]|nr:transposase [Anaerolineae bacterium]